MGYNKNVTKYVTLAREFEVKIRDHSFTWFHPNNQPKAASPTCSRGLVGWLVGCQYTHTYARMPIHFQAKTPGAVTTFVHNNAYKREELPECFERNSEGMLKNMVCVCARACVLGAGCRGHKLKPWPSVKTNVVDFTC